MTATEHPFIRIRDDLWCDQELSDRLVREGSRLAFGDILREFSELVPHFEVECVLQDVRAACHAGSAFEALLAYSASWPVSSREFKAFEDVYFMVHTGRLLEFQRKMEAVDPAEILSVPSYIKVRHDDNTMIAFRPMNAIGRCKVIAVPVRDGLLERDDDGAAAARAVHLSSIEAVLSPFEQPGMVHELVADLWRQRLTRGLPKSSISLIEEIWGRS